MGGTSAKLRPSRNISGSARAGVNSISSPDIRPGDARQPEWLVSYAWGDDTDAGRALDQVVNDICAEAERRGLRILRDRDELKLGDSISAFMRRIGEGDRVFVVLSAKYLRSPWCMFELFEVWQNCGRRKEAFLGKARVFVLPDAKFDSVPRRIEWARFWKDQYDEIDATIRTHGPGLVGEDDFRAFRRIQDFYLNVGNILATIADIVQPRTLAQFADYGFDDPRNDASDKKTVDAAGLPPAPIVLSSCKANAWADDLGEDQYGKWARISVGYGFQSKAEAFQRLRWCPPGRFMMGSPEDEDGRYDDEGPRHEVVFERGFWMFETACRQELWQAVMGDNPSSSKGPLLPVTNVSWEDAMRFVERLNARPGLGLDLPSEAQWEYACRAGTDTAYSFGPKVSRKLANYENKGPVSVGSLPPNRWGLHEMHGNVWEWCADPSHNNYDGAPADGSAWIGGGAAGRVIRGGSWLGDARDVRAAFRYRDDPSNRRGNLGFRCARVQRE